jgi:hypothetical protein
MSNATAAITVDLTGVRAVQFVFQTKKGRKQVVFGGAFVVLGSNRSRQILAGMVAEVVRY